MPAPLVVPDASVLLKWVLPSQDEPGADRALVLRDAIVEETVRACVPSLWVYEVGNTLGRRFPAQARAWLGLMAKFALQEAPRSEAWLQKTLELVSGLDVTFYDAAYHAVALIQGGTFVTADTRYVSRARKLGAVEFIADWQPPRRGARRG